jgi:hypothetical protein
MSKEQRDRQKVNINGRLYLQLDGFVKSNPKRDLILRMMHDKTDASSFIEELYTKDEGINILISKNPRDLIQIRWNQFHANPRGVQIWAAMAHPRPVDTLLRGYTSIDTLNNVFNYLRLHIEGDDLQASMLVSEYRHQLNSAGSTIIRKLETKATVLDDISFDTPEFRSVIAECDKLFDDTLQKTLTGWNNYGSPLMPHSLIDFMIDLVIVTIPHVWDVLADFRGLNTKNSREGRRAYLYKGKQRSVLFQLFSIARTRNNRCMVSWATIMSLSQYCRGCSKTSNIMANYFGIEISRSSLTPTIKNVKNIIKDTTKTILDDEEEYMFVFDNSQMVIIPKFATGNISSRVIKGTASFLRRMFGSDITIDFDGRRRCTLTFVRQAIPSPLGMHRFESVLDVWDIVQNPSSSSYCSMSPDVTGRRVAYYMHALLHAEALTVIHRIVSSCEQWENMPPILENNERRSIQEATRLCRPNLLAAGAHFQEAVVEQWNPFRSQLSDLFICPLSLKDDLKQRDVGMIVLDMAVANGLLVGPDEGPWELTPKWKKITIYVVGDFVSVRNLRAFIEKMSVKKVSSFNERQKQIDMFTKVLSRFVEIAGDWHVGLNILVTLFSLFYGGFLQVQ